MSVPVGQRSQSKLEAQLKVERLIAHTIQITSNPNVFDPKFHVLTDAVVKCSIQIGWHIWEANNIRVDSREKWIERRALQDRALRKFNVMLYLIGLCKPTFGIRAGKYGHWVQLTREAKTLTAKWRDSDARRFGI